MSDQTIFSIGKLCNGTEGRDAIHFAVAPVVVAERLSPGQHVALVAGEAVAHGDHVGIIDPFLPAPVFKGDRCWLFLYPNTITALRHDWTHPAFPTTAAPTIMGASEKWLRDYAERAGFSYERVLDTAKVYVHNGGDSHSDGLRYHSDIPDWMHTEAGVFWKHFQTVTGQAVPEDMKDRHIFWCSC